MAQSGLNRRPHGNVVLATGGHRAFVPAAMPPPIGWNATLAVSLSSRIEGTRTTLGELLAVDAGATVERSPADLHDSGNYVTALEYRLERLDGLPSSLRYAREL